ncbi:MAG TPA: DUF4129 domain-containing protein [Edaphocola sp.]|nr:DUF4129 domain-containing protein [Edaphocola sp.]
MTWSCFLSREAMAADSLSGQKPVVGISVKADTVTTGAGNAVYQNPDYFKRVPVEESDTLPDSASVHAFYLQMDGKYKSAEFDYNENRIDRLSWWERLKQWINDFLQRLLPHFDISLNKTIYYFAIGVGILALAYILYRLLAKGKKPFFREENDRANILPDWIEKKLMELNLNTYLDKALADKNYVLAVRYLHLINLKKLAGNHLIEWNYQKTNRDFLYELDAEHLKKDFANTIKVYEYAWYGGFGISESRFRQYRQLFEQFNHGITEKIPPSGKSEYNIIE